MTQPPACSELRARALQAFLCPDLQRKCALTAALADAASGLWAAGANSGVGGVGEVGEVGDGADIPLAAKPADSLAPRLDLQCTFLPAPDQPGRPARPLLVAPDRVPKRKFGSPVGRAALLHAVAHIEANAIDLALDVVWRFAGMPAAFYLDWIKVAGEEALHFGLLQSHLISLGHTYGEFAAHDGLWEMAYRTRHDVLARLALVPRTLEARGLDASPPMRARLSAAGDEAGALILDRILADEIGHVAIGNHWYRWLCAGRGCAVESTYHALAAQYHAPRLKGPFNISARRAAGFSEAELAELTGDPS